MQRDIDSRILYCHWVHYILTSLVAAAFVSESLTQMPWAPFDFVGFLLMTTTSLENCQSLFTPVFPFWHHSLKQEDLVACICATVKEVKCTYDSSSSATCYMWHHLLHAPLATHGITCYMWQCYSKQSKLESLGIGSELLMVACALWENTGRRQRDKGAGGFVGATTRVDRNVLPEWGQYSEWKSSNCHTQRQHTRQHAHNRFKSHTICKVVPKQTAQTEQKSAARKLLFGMRNHHCMQSNLYFTDLYKESFSKKLPMHTQVVSANLWYATLLL